MASIIITGRVKEITQMEQGTNAKGNIWRKQEVIIEEKSGRHTSDICLTAFNDDINKLGGISVGNEVEVTAWVETRISTSQAGKRYFQTSVSIDHVKALNQPRVQQQGYQQPQSQQQGYQQQPAQGYTPQTQNFQQPQRQMTQGHQPQGMHSQSQQVSQLQDNDIPDFFDTDPIF